VFVFCIYVYSRVCVCFICIYVCIHVCMYVGVSVEVEAGWLRLVGSIK